MVERGAFSNARIQLVGHERTVTGYQYEPDHEVNGNDQARERLGRDLADRRGDRGRGLDPDRGNDGYYGA